MLRYLRGLLLMDGHLIDRDVVDGSASAGKNDGGRRSAGRGPVQVTVTHAGRSRHHVAELLGVQIARAVVVALMRRIGYGSLAAVTLCPVFRQSDRLHLIEINR